MSKIKYQEVVTDNGKWLHANGSDFIFAFLKEEWAPDVKSSMSKAFEKALDMSNVIKTAVLETSGEKVVDGVYLLDKTAMIKAMNSIPGMGQTSTNEQNENGNGTAVSINKEFFTSVLAGLGGDVEPLMEYLTESMENLQVQTSKSSVTKKFGSVMGLVSLMPELDIPVTTFEYIYSSDTTSSWLVKLNCGSAEHYSYDYSYDVLDYNYDPSNDKEDTSLVGDNNNDDSCCCIIL